MPCDRITTTTLDMSKANPTVLAETLVSMGFKIAAISTGTHIVATQGNITIEWTQGQGTKVSSTYGTDQKIAEQLPRKYSAAAIAYAAKKNGWMFKQVEENKFQVIRR